MNKNRLLILICIVIIILTHFIFFPFNASRNSKVELAIANEVNEDISIIKIFEKGNAKFVLFRSDDDSNFGLASFRLGLLNRMALDTVNFGNSNEYFRILRIENDKFMLYGLNFENKIKKINVNNGVNDKIHGWKVQEGILFVIDDYSFNETNVKLIDNDGNMFANKIKLGENKMFTNSKSDFTYFYYFVEFFVMIIAVNRFIYIIKEKRIVRITRV